MGRKAVGRVLGLVLGVMLSPAAWAEQRGVVVRLDSGAAAPSGDVVVHLAAGGTKTDLPLKDDGERPDVTAGDGVFSGSVWLEGDAFEVSLTVDGKELKGGPVSWSAEDLGRDLSISLINGAVSLEAGVSSAAQPTAQGSAQPPTPGQPPGDGSAGQASPPQPGVASGVAPPGDPSDPTAPVSATPPSPSAQTSAPPPAAGGKADNGTLYIAFGVGLLALAGLLWYWTRGAKEGAAPLPSALPEPGLLGPSTPSLSQGVSIWTAGEERTAFSGPFLARLARHHRVVLAAPADESPPPVHGGPVYRAPADTPGAVAELVAALQEHGGAPVAVLWLSRSVAPEVLQAVSGALPTGVGAAVLVASADEAPFPRVAVRRDGEAWVIEGAGGATTTARVVDGALGTA